MVHRDYVTGEIFLGVVPRHGSFRAGRMISALLLAEAVAVRTLRTWLRKVLHLKNFNRRGDATSWADVVRGGSCLCGGIYDAVEESKGGDFGDEIVSPLSPSLSPRLAGSLEMDGEFNELRSEVLSTLSQLVCEGTTDLSSSRGGFCVISLWSASRVREWHQNCHMICSAFRARMDQLVGSGCSWPSTMTPLGRTIAGTQMLNHKVIL